MKRTVFFALLLASQCSVAAGFHYCTGKVTSLITRSSVEESTVGLEGMTGGAKIGYGGSGYTEMQKRQFSMLLAAYTAGKPVTLEFEDSAMTCASNHEGVLLRFVMLKS